jgi:hypothetical protein
MRRKRVARAGTSRHTSYACTSSHLPYTDLSKFMKYQVVAEEEYEYI